MELNYKRVRDYYLPGLYVRNDRKNNKPLNKYGIARLEYLKNYKKGLYTSLKMKNELKRHLIIVQRKAKLMEQRLIKSMMQNENINEELKAKDQLKWVGLMNNIKYSVNDIVMQEVIYK